MSKKDVAKKNVDKKEKKHFLKDFKAELKKVIWPTPKQLVNNVVAVITIVLITAIIVFALDFVFESANEYGVDKLKVLVENYDNNQTKSENSENVESSNTENVDNTENK